MNLSTNLLETLGTKLSSKIAKSARLVKYSHDELIHSRGVIKPGLSVVKSGAVNVGVYGVDGTFIQAAILGMGECFGEFTLFTDLPRTHDISALGTTEIYQLSKSSFNRLSTAEPEFSKALLRISLLRNHLLLEMLDAMRRLPLLERTASSLLTLQKTSGGKHSVSCKQADLAYNLGVSRVSIGKALRILQEQNLIQLGYGEIMYPDIAKLQSWVDTHCNLTPLHTSRSL